MKRILSVLLALVMIVGMIPMSILSASAATNEVVFELGANGSASHNDGSSKTSYSETNGDYTLSITSGTNMYTGARDAKGNSCIKLGTSSKTGSFQFTVPAAVTKVIIQVAQYKANATKVTVNGTSYTITTASTNGAYTDIEVDTTTEKTVKVTTVSGGVRAMVNSIKFVIPETTCAHANTTTTTVDAACETAGSVTVTCDDCGNTVSYETIEALGHNYVDSTCSLCGKITVMTQYELVTNVASLTADDQIIIVGTNDDKYYAMLPYTDGNNVKTAGVSAPVENVITLTAESEAARITLGGDNTGWTLYDGTKYYNAPGGTSNNYLKGVAELPTDNTATWTISIDADGVATIVNVGNNSGTEARNTIKFNYGNDPHLFSCYKAGYTTNVALVNIYREVKEGAEECQHTNTTDVAEIPATCGKSGTTAGVKCIDCGDIISGCEEIPATGEHSFVDYVCSVCGEVTLPAAGSELTLPAASAIGADHDHNQYTSDKYYVTGTVESITNNTYGNLYIQDEAGNKFYIYGTYSADGTIRYDAMATKPVAGDTVTLYGVIGNYSGTAQMKNGWLTAHISAAICEHTNTTTATVDATCETAGSVTVTCDDCGNTVSTETIPVLPHSYIDGVCENCGKDETEVEATITFDDKNKRTEFTTEIQVWEENGVTVTNNKASSTSNVGDYAKPARFYKGSNVTVAYPGLNKIVFNCNDAEYATALGNSITEGTVTVSEKIVTVDLETAVDSFTVNSLSAKVFVDSLTVYASKAAPVPTVELTHISLNPGADALGFKAAGTNMPEGATISISLWITEDIVVTRETSALRLVNIMFNNGGETTIYAKAVMTDKDGNVIAESAVEQTSMKETIQAVNKLTNLSDVQKAAVYALYEQYSETMAAWIEETGETNNIAAWAPEE